MTTSEATPLLIRSRSARSTRSRSASARPASHNVARIPYLVPFLIFMAFLSMSLTTTTIIELFRILSCQLWFLINDPDQIPPSGKLPDDMCRTAGAEGYFVIVMSVNGVVSGLGHFISGSFIAKFANRLGRRPVYIFIGVIDVTCQVVLLLSYIYSHSSWAFFGIVGSCTITALGGPIIESLVGSLMIADVVDPLERTTSMSRLSGAGFAGAVPAYALGGYINSRFGGQAVIAVSVVLMVISFLIAVVYLPETLLPEDRDLIVEEEEEERQLHPKNSLSYKIFITPFKAVFGPLRALLPTHNTITGSRNWRLTLFGVAGVFYYLGYAYFTTLALVYGPAVLQLTPAEIGYILSIVQFSKVITLFVILPIIVKYGRPLYARKQSLVIPKDEPPAEPISSMSVPLEFGVPDVDPAVPSAIHPTLTEEEVEREEALYEAKESVSSHFDVHLVLGSWIVEIIAFLFAAWAVTKWQFIAALMIYALSSGFKAGLDSAVVASVDPLQTSPALAAMTMITSISEVIAPIIFGNILAATIDSQPTLVFYLMSICIGIACVAVAFVKDSDRHIPVPKDTPQPHYDGRPVV